MRNKKRYQKDTNRVLKNIGGVLLRSATGASSTNVFKQRSDKWAKLEDTFSNGVVDDSDLILGVNINVPIAGVFCAEHAAYVFKSVDISCNPFGSTAVDDQLAQKREDVLNLFWKEQMVHEKLRRMVEKGTYTNEMSCKLETCNKTKRVKLKILGPETIVHPEDIDDPASRAKYVYTRKYFYKESLIDYVGDEYIEGGIDRYFGKYEKNLEKGLHFNEFHDSEYVYLLYGSEVVYKRKHELDFLPFYTTPYFANKSSLLESINGLSQMYQFFLNAHCSTALGSVKRATFISGRGSAKEIKLGDSEIIKFNGDGAMSMPTLPDSGANFREIISTLQTIIHFVSGLSAEGMSGFTGALDVAGVSIELRMDSTTRQAVRVQSGLKPMIEQMNADYILLMEQYFPAEDLSVSTKQGRVFKDSVYIKDLNGFRQNNISFAPVTPRSDLQSSQMLIALHNNGGISKKTMIDSLGYDPTVEIDRIRSEKIEDSIYFQAMQQGIKTKDKPLTPEEEVQAILEKRDIEWQFPLLVGADQGPYIEALQAAYEKSGNFMIKYALDKHINLQQQSVGLNTMKPQNPQDIYNNKYNEIVQNPIPGQDSQSSSPQMQGSQGYKEGMNAHNLKLQQEAQARQGR